MKKEPQREHVLVDFVIVRGIIYAVGSEDRLYRLRLNPEFCDCLGFTNRQTCKHIIAARKRAEAVCAANVRSRKKEA